jgi:putative N-acetyltransferase (TIGR04045 family)
MLLEPVKDYLHSEFRVKFATGDWEHAQASRLRRMVFCVEQQIFLNDDGAPALSDRDEIDARAISIVAFACMAGMPEQIAGTVRIDERAPGVWHGSRLALHPAFRGHGGVAAGLIRLAVSSAHARGCHLFLAQVQMQNTRLFRRLHWTSVEDVMVHGRAHQVMSADLNWYPPFANGEDGFVTLGR